MFGMIAVLIGGVKDIKRVFGIQTRVLFVCVWIELCVCRK